MDSVKDDDENDKNFLPSPLSESSDRSSDGTESRSKFNCSDLSLNLFAATKS